MEPVTRAGTAYDAAFFESLHDGASRSAAAAVPLLCAFFHPRSVVDVGCGTGLWLAAFRAQGVIDVLGIDGPWVPGSQRAIPEALFREHDLARPLTLDRRFDLALCLEAAEHLPAEAAPLLVESLTRLAPVVVFSAAIPHQGGDGHVNEQWPSYWARLFGSRGYEVVPFLRQSLWNRSDLEVWYRQNMLCFAARAQRDRLAPLSRASADADLSLLDVVHPALYLRLTWDLAWQARSTAEAQNALLQCRHELRRSRNELAQIHGSRGWRVLQALRAARAAARRATARFRPATRARSCMP